MKGNRERIIEKRVFRKNNLLQILSIALIIALLPVPVQAVSEVVRRGPVDKMQVALTFDDGYDPVNTTKVLDVLKTHDIVGTFFLNGKAIENNPKQARRVVNEGHELANHSYSHQRLTEISSSEVFKEISLTEKAAKEVTGQEIGRIFRVPFGAFNQEVLNLLKEAGYPYAIQWTIDPRDWEGPPAKAIHEQVIREIKPGAIVVLHVNYDSVNTAAALPGIIKDLKAKGYEFVTISEMIFGSKIGGIHRVQHGETLYKIADQYGVSVDVLADINDLKDLNMISPAPNPEPKPHQEYTVQGGDSLHRIAKDYGITLEDLLFTNRIQNATHVFVGQRIIIPEETSVPDKTPAAKEIPAFEVTSFPEEEGLEKGQWLNPKDYNPVWVKAGKSLHRLAADYRVTVEQLLDENGGVNPNIRVDEEQIQLL